MTDIIEIFVGDYLYVVFPEQTKPRRVTVTHIDDGDIIYGNMYDRSKKKYEKRKIALDWVTGVRLLSRKNLNLTSTVSALLVYEHILVE